MKIAIDAQILLQNHRRWEVGEDPYVIAEALEAGGKRPKDTRRRRTTDGGGASGVPAMETGETTAEHEEWKAQALMEAIENGDLALFLSTWGEKDGDAVETAERLGLMASGSEDGGLYMR